MNWPLILISYFSLFVFGITDNIRGPIFPELLRDFHLSDSLGSMLFSLSSLFGFLISLSSLYFIKKIGRRRFLQWGSIGLCIALGLMGVTHLYSVLLLASILFGISSGILGLMPNILVPLAAQNEKRQQAISGLHAMYGISSLLAPLFVTMSVSLWGDWRWCVRISLIFPVIMFLYSTFLKNDDYYPEKQKVSEDEGLSSSLKINQTKSKILGQIYLGLTLSFAVSTEVMLSSRIPLFLKRVTGFSLKESSLYLTYFFVAMLLGRLLFTFVKFKYRLEWQMSFLGVLTLIALAFGLNGYPFSLVLAGLFIAPFYPLMAAFIAEHFPHDLDQAMSIVVAIDSVMLAMMHLLIGKLTDIFSIQMAMMSGVVFLLLSLILLNSFAFLFHRKV